MDWPGLWNSHEPMDRLKRAALVPASHLYAFGWRAYLAWYATGFKRRFRASVPIVCVGSISVGGVGKTPVTIAIGRLLLRAGTRIAIMCSGYRAPCVVAEVAPGQHAEPALVGDEGAVLHAALPEAPLFVGRDRVRVARMAAARPGVEAIVMDDGFQHLPLARTLDLVVMDGARPFGNGRCLPAGPLREPRSGLKRADVLLVAGSYSGLELPPLPAFTFSRRPTGLRSLDGSRHEPLHWLRGREVLAVSGIGDPQRFEQCLAVQGASVRPLRYPDHHDYGAEDARLLQGHDVITTEKDAVKLRRYPGLSTVWVLHEEVEFDDGAAFREFLLKAIERDRIKRN